MEVLWNQKNLTEHFIQSFSLSIAEVDSLIDDGIHISMVDLDLILRLGLNFKLLLAMFLIHVKVGYEAVFLVVLKYRSLYMGSWSI